MLHSSGFTRASRRFRQHARGWRFIVLVAWSIALTLAGSQAPAAPTAPTATPRALTPTPTLAQPAATSTLAAAQPTATPNPGPAAWETQWNATLAKARQEGRLVVVTGVGREADLVERKLPELAKRWGFEIELRSMRPSNIGTVILEECKANRPSMDIILSAGFSFTAAHKEGCYTSMKDKLILPEVTTESNWRDGRLKFRDPERAFFPQYMDAIYGSVLYNTQRVKPAEISSIKDLLNPKFKGRIAAFDPRIPGSGQGGASHLLQSLGEQFLRDLYIGQAVTYTRDNSQLVEWVARGVYDIGIDPNDPEMQRFMRQGLPIAVHVFKDYPGYNTGAAGVMALVKGAPHPNAAIIMANWMLSREGQQFAMTSQNTPTARLDIPVDSSIGAWRVPQPGIQYDETYEWERYWTKRPEVRKVVVTILGAK